MSEAMTISVKTEGEKTKMGLFGRREIVTPVETITRKNLVAVLTQALAVHSENSAQIDYLYRYMRGEQPILNRKKKVRPEICNKIVENHAAEIAQFTSGYFLGEPVTYVRRGDKAGSSDELSTLNDFMFYEDKASHDKNMATWMAVCGVGYRMVLPDKDAGVTPDEAPFALDTLDPRYTFVVYHSGFGHKRVMGVRQVFRATGDDTFEMTCCGYTPTHYFEVKGGRVTVWKPHTLEDIPIIEYRLNMLSMGSFEPAIPLLDAMNTLASNRLDGVETFVQSLLKFKNCELEDEKVRALSELGAVFIKSIGEMDGDVDILSQELNQTQTQTLVDYLYDQVLAICGLPTSTKGGSSTSDTGAAVFLRDGWSQCEARARDTELLFKKSEKLFLRLVLRIIRDTREFKLSLSEVECKFTRRQHDNLTSKAQSLITILEAGLAPEVAISTCGLFNDPMDVVAQSRDYLKKWDYKESQPVPTPPDPVPGEGEEDPEKDGDPKPAEKTEPELD